MADSKKDDVKRSKGLGAGYSDDSAPPTIAADQIIQKSEEKYSKLFETLTDAFVIFDTATGFYVEANEAAQKLYGYTREEFLKLAPLEITAEPENTAIAIQQVIIDKLTKVSLRHHRKKDGTVFPVEITASPLTIGGSTLVYGIIKDITERMQTENALRANDERYSQLIDAAEIGFVVIDFKGIVVEVNNPYLRLIGAQNINEVIGHTVLEWTAPEERDNNAAAVDQCARQGFIRDFETIYIHRNGERVNILINAAVRLTPAGTELISFCRNITDRKRAENELAARERTLRILLDSFPHYTLLLDRDGIILAVNDAMCKRLGKSREELVGTKFTGYLPPELAENRWQIVQKVVNSGLPVSYEDVNHGYILSNSAFPVFGSQGEVTAVAVFVEDITQERNLEEKLEMYRKKMARGEQLATVGTMSAMVAHQLNQPLTVMRLLLQDAQESLKSGRLSKTIAQRIANVLTEVDMAEAIAKNLLQWSRPSPVNHCQSLNLMNIAEHIVKFLSETARRAGVELTVDASLNNIGELVGNPTDFEQIFFIMIENAIHAAEGKKKCRLQISGGLEDRQVNLTFSDTCGGIESENIDHVFDPFFTTKTPDKGTGLGLTIVKRIVESYGGSIKAESRHGHGTVFHIKMPLAMLK